MDYSIFSQSLLFTGLNPDQIKLILTNVPFRIRKFNSGKLIFQSGEIVKSMAFVISGYVKGEMVDYTGRVIKIEDIIAPGAIAPAFLFGRMNRYPVNVIAVPETTLMLIEKQDFLVMLQSDNNVLVNFLDMISNRSQFLSGKIKFLSFKTIKSKLAQYIIELAGPSKDVIRLDRTQNDLADYFGVARPSVARALGDLEEDGIIVTKGKEIRILNRALLTSFMTDQVPLREG
ncbi:MAG TPA: Crp/Fnr family transcriptional regulator [Bacteroidales bacterium]|nr:Crp/Fnr family transcriptional regulator [Bacteroidales bacterium]